MMNYLKGFFIIDIISVFPITYTMNSKTADGLARLARLPRLYKLLRLMKLIRMLKVLKEKNRFLSMLNDYVRLKPSQERLILFFLFVLLFTHVMSCLWYFSSKFDGMNP